MLCFDFEQIFVCMWFWAKHLVGFLKMYVTLIKLNINFKRLLFLARSWQIWSVNKSNEKWLNDRVAACLPHDDGGPWLIVFFFFGIKKNNFNSDFSRRCGVSLNWGAYQIYATSSVTRFPLRIYVLLNYKQQMSTRDIIKWQITKKQHLTSTLIQFGVLLNKLHEGCLGGL